MKRPATSSSARGLLLVEAVLSAAVIAVGLVFISRGLSGQLRALRAVEEHETLLALAHRKLLELETVRSAARPVPPNREGLFAPPDDGTRWAMSAAAREEEEPGDPLADITVTVKRAAMPSTAVSLSAVWRADQVPAEWF